MRIMGWMRKKSLLHHLIEQGEHQQQDFKFAISDSKKIARSLTAFANTDGGRLLVGVKDNGAIVGVSSNEEFYMIEGAAERFCKPPVTFSMKEWNVEGKTVLEIIVKKSENVLHSAPNKDGIYKVYTRVADQNLLVNRIYIDAFNKKQRSGLILRITKPVQFLVQYLSENEQITFSAFCRKAALKNESARKILSHLVALDIIKINFTEKTVHYSLNHEMVNEELEELKNKS